MVRLVALGLIIKSSALTKSYVTATANPPAVHDWHVPVALIDFKKLKDANWDITASKVHRSETLPGDIVHILIVSILTCRSANISTECNMSSG